MISTYNLNVQADYERRVFQDALELIGRHTNADLAEVIELAHDFVSQVLALGARTAAAREEHTTRTNAGAG